MKIDFSQLLLDMDGNPLKMQGGDTKSGTTAVTLGFVCVTALRNLHPADEQDQTAEIEKQHDRWVLYNRIHHTPVDLEVKSDQITLIKKRLPLFWGPDVCGPASILLEGGKLPDFKAKAGAK